MVIKKYQCVKCNKIIEHIHKSINDEVVPSCSCGGDMVRYYTPPMIGKLNRDWTQGKSDEYISSVLIGDTEPSF